ncbi:hypothetical protein PHYPSEUDO_003958 [Phytophthora pseudosyringae]|uniref:TKL protein kinase n=1 Tax=Phytophthora pseudosyringae TaxID=221518 RepID=A0A8T1VPY7_9STRA|nr:hypothetical protein PHYPSEUDO_003958 [Phytophthora pseudosyringae]
MLHLLWLLLLQLNSPLAAAATYSIEGFYLDGVCSTSNAYQAHAVAVSDCTATACSNGGNLSSSSSSGGVVGSDVESIECSTDYVTSLINVLGGSTYVIVVRFEDENCTTLYYGYGTTELGTCEENKYQGGYSISALDADGSASIQYFSDPTCSSTYASVTANSSAVTNHECSSSNYAWYTSGGPQLASDSRGAVSTSSTSGSSGDGRNYSRGDIHEPVSAAYSGD